jgi:hypothetical protein
MLESFRFPGGSSVSPIGAASGLITTANAALHIDGFNIIAVSIAPRTVLQLYPQTMTRNLAIGLRRIWFLRWCAPDRSETRVPLPQRRNTIDALPAYISAL